METKIQFLLKKEKYEMECLQIGDTMIKSDIFIMNFRLKPHYKRITRCFFVFQEGEILINADVTFPVYARLCLLPSSPFEKDNPFMLHPNLLHVNMKLNKRKRKLEVKFQ